LISPILSIVVASFRRHEALELCLADLAAQRSAPPFEVILVLQDYPADAVERIRDRFAPILDLRVAEYGDGLGTARARNAGIAMSRGTIVAFLDDDVRLPSSWASELMRFYEDPTIGGVGGLVDHPGHYSLPRRALYRALGVTSDRYRIDWGGFNVGPARHSERDQPAEWLSGGNMSFRREALSAVGGFDESIGSFWHEDVDLTHRVAKSGWKILSSGRIAVDHYPSNVNRPTLHEQMRERERSRVLFVWRAIGDQPLWRARYVARLILHAAAMGVIGVGKADLRIPANVVRGGFEGLKELPQARSASEAAVRSVL
jgi:GT2 family glycosyltransferase